MLKKKKAIHCGLELVRRSNTVNDTIGYGIRNCQGCKYLKDKESSCGCILDDEGFAYIFCTRMTPHRYNGTQVYIYAEEKEIL